VHSPNFQYSLKIEENKLVSGFGYF
jgi:hypothetical protein